ncbi:hypothetical protein GCM10023219_20560 [Stakelama sediminis]|uniref:DNA-binding GntR family transcriptional regulator n=1 Tax=Stakelama sediminis TaxID=463200 RepID=A0A840Z1Z9_9SPHN|nr:GntR family transcriptional regulator [Stakelama sediminis]MBB5719923.1 DNA-binding GntR family transcriptional regulator [Stakelama sediminis]
MNAGATTERIYGAIRDRLMSGQYRPGARIDLPALADELMSSVTPVRDALHLMVGEQLLENPSGEGFHIPGVSVPALSDLYSWNCDILMLALRNRAPAETDTPSVAGTDRACADRTAQCFSRIARRSVNSELHRAIASVNDRLHCVRMVEPRQFPGWENELAGINQALEDQDLTAARGRLRSYHRRRLTALPAMVRILR